MNNAQMMYGIDTMAVLGWSLISFTLDKTGVVSSLGGGDDTKCLSSNAAVDCVTGGWKYDQEGVCHAGHWIKLSGVFNTIGEWRLH